LLKTPQWLEYLEYTHKEKMFAKFVVLVVCLAIVAAKPKWHQLDGYTFEKYVQDFNQNYSASELGARRALFTAELARVRAHNAKNLSWKEGINKFSAMTGAEKKGFHGRSKGAAHHQKLTAARPMPSDFEMKPVSALPTNVDWRTKGKSTFTLRLWKICPEKCPGRRHKTDITFSFTGDL
jgi:cathepsin L